tara:strand:+ start:562 stop:1314 length:753 start_codon:yes stop_codon:yes gene_type:complete
VFDIFSNLEAMHIIGMLAAVFIAAMLRAFTGFGFALAALPVLSMFLAPSTSVSIIATLTLLISLPTLKSYWGVVPFPPIAGMLALSAMGTLGGVYILLLISPDIFRLSIGITVMIACALLSRFRPKERKIGGPLAWLVGLSSGIMNGAIAIPGPPVIVYAMAVFPEPAKSRAFLMLFFLFSAIFAVSGFAWEGIIGWQEIGLIALALPSMLAGDKLGFWLFHKHGTNTYRKIAIIALFAIGASVTINVII